MIRYPSLRRTAVILAIILSVTLAVPITAEAALVGEREISSQAAIVVDVETGVELYEHNADAQRVPASLTKLMAVYVIYDAVRAGEISLDTQARISRSTSSFSYDWEYSNVPLLEGSTVSIIRLLEVVIIRSACAATVALGEALCGSESAFVARMNQTASRLGITARFYDCYGGSPDNRISARGLAILSRELVRDFPEILNITSRRTVTFNGVTYNSSNLLLGEYSGLDGLKTGYTVPAGYCFVGTAQRGGRRIISVTLGSTLSSRYPDTRALLDYGFSVADSVIAEHNKNTLADPSSANLVLNGAETPLTAYIIDELHYFKLRDIALLLTGTDCGFEVTWDDSAKTASMISGMPYTAIGGELSVAESGPRPYIPTTSRVLFNGAERPLEAYLIDNSNYFKLRDLGDMLGFDVNWVPATKTVVINTPDGNSGTAGPPDDSGSGSLTVFFFDVITDIIASDLFMDTSIETLAFDMYELRSMSAADKNELTLMLHDAYGFAVIQASIDELMELGLIAADGDILFESGLLFTFINMETMSDDEFVFSISVWRGALSTNFFIDYRAERDPDGEWVFIRDVEF